MGRKFKVSPHLKLQAVKEYYSGNGSTNDIAKKYGVSQPSFRGWLRKYETFGPEGLKRSANNQAYSSTFKEKVALSYINKEGSLSEIAKKYKLHSKKQVLDWVLKYNGHETLKDSRRGAHSTMTKGRKTTFNERVEIVKYCIENENNYSKTASEYQVSYQQVYTWCRKYRMNGIESLQDKRGRNKQIDELSEVEKLRAENKLLKAQNKRIDLENMFLKKLEEIERGRY